MVFEPRAFTYVGGVLLLGLVAYTAVNEFSPRSKELRRLDTTIESARRINVKSGITRVPEWLAYDHRELAHAGFDYDLLGEEAIAKLARARIDNGDGTFNVPDLTPKDGLYGDKDKHLITVR